MASLRAVEGLGEQLVLVHLVVCVARDARQDGGGVDFVPGLREGGCEGGLVGGRLQRVLERELHLGGPQGGVRVLREGLDGGARDAAGAEVLDIVRDELGHFGFDLARDGVVEGEGALHEDVDVDGRGARQEALDNLCLAGELSALGSLFYCAGAAVAVCGVFGAEFHGLRCRGFFRELELPALFFGLGERGEPACEVCALGLDVSWCLRDQLHCAILAV